MSRDAFFTAETYCCPSCGATINIPINESASVVCEYCGSRVRFSSNQPQNYHVTYREDLEPEKVILRAGHLIYNGEFNLAKEIVQKTLTYYPSNRRLLELENVIRCFETRSFSNYIKMLSVCTYLNEDIERRFAIEINGYCNMLSDKANNRLNIARYRKQNIENFLYLYDYLPDIKRCLVNEAVINSKDLYDVVLKSARKFSVILCNTIYSNNGIYFYPISLSQRKQIADDFDELADIFDSTYRTVSDCEFRKYIRE